MLYASLLLPQNPNITSHDSFLQRCSCHLKEQDALQTQMQDTLGDLQRGSAQRTYLFGQILCIGEILPVFRMHSVLTKRSKSNGCERWCAAARYRALSNQQPARRRRISASLPYCSLDQPTVHSPLHTATSLYKAQVKITPALDKASLITEYRVLDCSLHIAFIYKNIKLSNI